MDESLLFSRISEDEFQARRVQRIQVPVPACLRRIDQLSSKYGRVAIVFFDGTVVAGISLGIEPDFDDFGEIIDCWVVGIMGDDGIVTLVPDYLTDDAYLIWGNSHNRNS